MSSISNYNTCTYFGWFWLKKPHLFDRILHNMTEGAWSSLRQVFLVLDSDYLRYFTHFLGFTTRVHVVNFIYYRYLSKLEIINLCISDKFITLLPLLTFLHGFCFHTIIKRINKLVTRVFFWNKMQSTSRVTGSLLVDISSEWWAGLFWVRWSRRLNWTAVQWPDSSLCFNI